MIDPIRFLAALPSRQTLRVGSPRMAKPSVRAKSAPPMRITLGIDAAGRGPAVGPMVIAAVALHSRSAAALTHAGLCDPKTHGAGDDPHALRCPPGPQVRLPP